MKNSKLIFSTLFIVNFLFICFYIYKSTNLYFIESKELDVIDIGSVFGSLIVGNIFLVKYILIKKKLKSIKTKGLKLVLKYLQIILLLISVLYLLIYVNYLVEGGFLTGSDLYWQITTLISGLASCILYVQGLKRIKL